MADKKTETKLRRAHDKVGSAMAGLSQAKTGFNEAILEARSKGMTTNELATILGVSRSRAWEMLRQADGRGRSGR